MTTVPLRPFPAPGMRRRRSPALRRTVSGLALLAGSFGLAGLATPASAQCVENPANTYTCSGSLDTTQALNGPTVTITTSPGFTLDTLSNGGGSTFVVTGQGTVAYIDENGSRLAGGGAYFTSDTGDLVIVSNGEIDSDLGLEGLRLTTLNGGDINVTWTGHIDNSSGDGVHVTGTGDINMIVSSVTAQDTGIRASLSGSGEINITAAGDIVVQNGPGVNVVAGAASAGGISLDLRGVASGDTGVNIINQGTGGTIVRATGPISGVMGMRLTNEAGSGEIFVDVGDVSGIDSGVFVTNYGVSDTFLQTGNLSSSGGHGLQVHNSETTRNLAIVTGGVNANGRGIQASNGGTGDTSIITEGTVTTGGDGIYVHNTAIGQDMSVWTQAVQAGLSGISVSQEGAGSVELRADGTIVGLGGDGIRISADVLSTSVSVTTQEVIARNTGILVDHAGSGGIEVIATGAIVGEREAGVRVSSGPASGYVTLDLLEVTGGEYGVEVDNGGLGGTVLRAAGPVLSNGAGIHVENAAGSGEVFIDVTDVSGVDAAIIAINNGVTGTFVRTHHLLSEGTALTVNNGATAGDVTVFTRDVLGGGAGIVIDNQGAFAETLLTVEGVVIAEQGDGVNVSNGAQGQNLFIDVETVLAGDNAIVASHAGSGVVDVAAAAAVIGTGGDGVRVSAGTQSTGMRVTTAAVSGGQNGISVDNAGGGDTLVTATDVVIGEQQDGIRVDNGQNAGDLNINVGTVQGGENGIFVSHSGAGVVDLSATGTVIGEAVDGIRVNATGQSAGVSVNANSASGAMNGVEVGNFGAGDTVVTLTGLVIGETTNGLQVNHGTNAGNLLIDVAAAIGDQHGISAINQASSETSIVVHDLAQGSMAGVAVSALFGGDIHIENQGSIRGDAMAPTSRALRASTADAITVNNAGTLLGTAELHGGGALLFNTGIWINSGESLFDGADDWVVNSASGQIFAASDAAAAETTAWTGLERFNNDSTLSLIDSGAGDRLLTSAETVFQAPSVLAVDLGGVASDVFRTESTLEIEAGAELALNQVGALTLHHRYVVAEALQGLTGEFDFDDIFLTAFAGLRDGYTDTQAYVEFAQLRALAEAGLTPNQKAAAGGADSLPNGTPVKDALLLLPSDEIARDAFDQLSGEVHATARMATMEDSRLPRDAVLDRLAKAEGTGAVWARAFEGRGVGDGDSNAARADRDVRGVMAGVDRSLGGIATVGAAMGVLKSGVDVERRASEAEVESVHGLVYGGVEQGAWRVSGGLGYARTVTESRREIAFPGFSGAPIAEYDGSVLQGFVEAGYRRAASGGWAEPFASLAAVRVQSDAFVEDGGSEALSGERINHDALISTLGLRFETNPASRFSLRGMTGWRRTWSDVDPAGVHAFDGGAPFEVLGAAQSGDAAVARVEAHWRLSDRTGVGLGYDGVIGDQGDDHAITGTFRVVF